MAVRKNTDRRLLNCFPRAHHSTIRAEKGGLNLHFMGFKSPKLLGLMVARAARGSCTTNSVQKKKQRLLFQLTPPPSTPKVANWGDRSNRLGLFFNSQEGIA